MLFPPPLSYAADYSTYRLEIGEFAGVENVQNALNKLTTDTGWWATYQKTGNKYTAYKVISGGFLGKSKVEEVIQRLKNETNIQASYEPIGPLAPYKRIISRDYLGEDKVKNIVNEFIQSTGLNVTYERNNSPVYKSKVVSGGFYGEEKVKNVLQEFNNLSGISATYVPYGNYIEGIKVVTGGFLGELKVKEVLADFKNHTQINASYEPIGYENQFNILVGGFAGENKVIQIINEIESKFGIRGTYYLSDAQNQIYYIKYDGVYGESLKKITNLFKERNWWYSQTLSDTKVPVLFSIVTDELTNSALVERALKYFSDRNWWVTTEKTGNKYYDYFRIETESLLESEKINKALKYFTERNWYATTQKTNEVEYPYFSIIVNNLLEPEDIQKAEAFLKGRNYWYTVENTGTYGYNTYRIVTPELYSETDKNKVLNFFQKNNWWVTSNKVDGDMYKIVTGGFVGYDKALESQNFVKEKYGWWSTIVLINPQIKKTYYNLTLSQALQYQMKASPQTDKYKNSPAYISSKYIELIEGGYINSGVNIRTSPKLNSNDNVYKTLSSAVTVTILDKNVIGDPYAGSTIWYKILYENKELYVHSSLINVNSKIGRVTANGVNVRADKSESSHIYGIANSGDTFTILEVGTDWHKISYTTWRNATSEDVLYYLNPENFINDTVQRFQFLDLSKPSGVSASVLNNYLANKGILKGHGQTFIDAAKANGINDLYLVAHALLETGNGTSELANGVMYNGKKVYNMFGIGAYDSNPTLGGAKFAYENGWFSVEAAIKGGAAFIGNSYIKAGQNTLYKMRWNPDGMVKYGYATHQYATDIGWASKQLTSIYNLYNEIGNVTLYLDVPVYK